MRRRRPHLLSQAAFVVVLVILTVAIFLHLHKSSKAIAEPTQTDHGAPLISAPTTRPAAPVARATTNPTSQPALLAAAKGKAADGDLVSARAMLNDALPTMTAGDAEVAKQ